MEEVYKQSAHYAYQEGSNIIGSDILNLINRRRPATSVHRFNLLISSVQLLGKLFQIQSELTNNRHGHETAELNKMMLEILNGSNSEMRGIKKRLEEFVNLREFQNNSDSDRINAMLTYMYLYVEKLSTLVENANGEAFLEIYEHLEDTPDELNPQMFEKNRVFNEVINQLKAQIRK